MKSNIKGLTNKEVLSSRDKYGTNQIDKVKDLPLIIKILKIFKEPMFLLLLIASSVYFFVGEYIDGIIMLIFVLGICIIEFFQEHKTEKALEELNKLSSLNVKVIRDDEKKLILSDDLVVGDVVILEEGDYVPADGEILYLESLGINESSLTGESTTVYKQIKDDKENHFKLNYCYSGSSVTSGYAIIKIINIGMNTEIGKIGKSLKSIEKNKTNLEKEINKIVLFCTIICIIVFILTIILCFINNEQLELKTRIVNSVLSGITIAMATIPEEIPVIFTVFMAMGSLALTKEKVLTKNNKTIETLGNINVLCTDKTGTITQNKMKVQSIFSYSKTFNETSFLACPVISYDNMDIAIKKYFKIKTKRKKITKVYPFNPKDKMVGNIWDNKFLCVKGAYESIIPFCNLNDEDNKIINEKIKEYTSSGYRVLAVAKKDNLEEIPNKLKNISLTFEGLIALYDPPRNGIKSSIKACQNAGIRVIMITGDSKDTAKGIGKIINIENPDYILTGEEIEKMTDEELFEKVKDINIFARVYPNHKMRIVESFQKDNKIVAMTGDGVNDAPALKKADVGIAMGQRGTNVAKSSADLILLDDNFNTIVKAIEKGRGIYKNIKKAINYIIIIHIPIALLSLFTHLFKLPNLLLPIHVMLLELLIDPSSSILFEQMEIPKNIMNEKPRNINEKIINKKILIKCFLQGLLIFLITFLNYYFLIKYNFNINKAITITYSILVLSIMLVTFELKDEKLTIISLTESLKNKIIVFVNGGILIALLLIIYLPFFNNVANTIPISIIDWLYILIITLLTVLPFDLLKTKKIYN